MAPTSASLACTLVAVLLLPGLTQDLLLNTSDPAHHSGDRLQASARLALRGGEQKVAALPRQLNATSTKHHGGDKGVIALGSCSPSDQAAMNAYGPGTGSGSWGALVNSCGRGARTWFSWSGSAFTSCLVSHGSISGPCSQCFLPAGIYAWTNCKFTCFFNTWCSESCLRCLYPTQGSVESCVGFSVPKPTEAC